MAVTSVKAGSDPKADPAAILQLFHSPVREVITSFMDCGKPQYEVVLLEDGRYVFFDHAYTDRTVFAASDDVFELLDKVRELQRQDVVPIFDAALAQVFAVVFRHHAEAFAGFATVN